MVLTYITAVCVFAGALIAAMAARYGPGKDLVAATVLLSMAVIAHALREREVGVRVTISLTSVILLASIPLVGPVGAALIAVVHTATDIRSLPIRVWCFNFGMMGASAIVGGLAYVLAGGTLDIRALGEGGFTTDEIFTQVGFPLIAADLAQLLCNAVILTGIMHLDRGVPYRRFLVGMLRTSGPGYFAYGIIGFLLTILWVPAGVGPISALLIVAPLVVARWTFGQYGDEVRAHRGTLDMLVHATEAKNPFSAGHSARVAQVSEWVAEAMSLPSTTQQELRYAAMLHDVGTIAIPSARLRSDAPLTSGDVRLIASHTYIGCDLVRDVDFLEPSLAGIQHHHERFDGTGYPDGLAEDEIPLAARIIAVADYLDAVTIERPDRTSLSISQALDAVRERAGRDFDPDVVAALTSALARHTFVPGQRTGPRSGWREVYLDHDDPEVADIIAGVSGSSRTTSGRRR